MEEEEAEEEEEEEETRRRSLRPRKRPHSNDITPPVRKAMKKEPGVRVSKSKESREARASSVAGISGVEQCLESPGCGWRCCDNAACLGRRPICISLSDKRCTLSSHTDRWHHMSCGEHFCDHCYEGLTEQLTSPENQADFRLWLARWKERAADTDETGQSYIDGAIRHFMAYYKLPFWARCTRCRQWRQIPRSIEASCSDGTWLARFTCAMLVPRLGASVCDRPEDERVAMARLEDFTKHVCYRPLLQSSPVTLLLSSFPPHTVGVNDHAPSTNGLPPTTSDQLQLCGPNLLSFPKPSGIPVFLHPFRQPGCEPIAMDLPPNDVLQDELCECEELTSRENLQTLYLGVRNLILGLWAMNVKEWLTPEAVAQHLWIRGLVRVRLVDHVIPNLISYFTERGLVNYGLLPDLPGPLQRHLFLPPPRRFSCVVVGAGIAGLVAARQLQTLGCDVTVLEGAARVGGRIRNIAVPRKVATRHNGQTIRLPLGAHIVHGCVNNPLAVVAHQADLKLIPVPEVAVLFSADHCGVVPVSVEQRAEFHFLAVCERIRYLRDRLLESPTAELQKDKSFGEVYRRESQAALKKLSDMKSEHLNVLRFFEADLECANSTGMDTLSWLYWDANEYSAQFAGAPVMIGDAAGLEKVAQQMARGLNVRTSRHVQSIEEDGERLMVRTTDGEEFPCDRVMLTVPFPTLLNDQRIRLNADEALAKAARRLGCGRKEKVLLLFRQRFWDAALKEAGAADAHFIGRVPEGREDTGFCHLFQDLDPQNREIAALETQLFGEALDVWRKRPHAELITAITMVLRPIFPKVAPSVLEPIWSHLTCWSDSESAGSTCVYRAVGCKQSDFDHLSKPLMDNRLFCIGEGTYTHFPQSVTGAFLSGLSGAFRITAS